MKILESLDHPLVFLLALTIGVLAMQKLIAYGAGKAGLDEMSRWAVNK
jgi:hypothetical protein